MCGRFALTTSPEVIAAVFRLSDAPVLRPRYNIAPTQDALIVRVMDGQREGELLHWGLVPFWSRDQSINARLINARSETAAGRAAFRNAFRKRRCLVPASGFFEWRREDRRKRPFYIRSSNGSPLALAGLWEEWRDPDRPDAPIMESFAILTTEPNVLMRDIHNRMPVIVDPADHDLWLDPKVDEPEMVHHLLRPAPSDWLEAVPVSNYVNSPANDGPACVHPIRAEAFGDAFSPDPQDEDNEAPGTLWG